MLGLGARPPFKIFNLFLVPKNIGQHIFILARKLPTHGLKLNFMLGKQRERLSYGAHCRSSINAVKLISLPGRYSINGREINKYMQDTGYTLIQPKCKP